MLNIHNRFFTLEINFTEEHYHFECGAVGCLVMVLVVLGLCAWLRG